MVSRRWREGDQGVAGAEEEEGEVSPGAGMLHR
jgi:hypothetical protein